MTGLSPQTTRDEIQQAFQPYGNVMDIYMPAKPGGGSKGTAFVTFESQTSVHAVLARGTQHYVGPQVVTVDMAKPRDPLPSGGGGKGGGIVSGDKTIHPISFGNNGGFGGSYGGHGGWQGGGGPAMPYTPAGGWHGKGGYSPAPYFPAPSRPQKELPPAAAAGHRLFVTKISQDIVIDDVRNHFGQYGVMGDFYMPSPPHNKERHKGIAFITYDSPEIAQQVTTIPHNIKGCDVVVEQAIARAEPNGPALQNGPDDELRPTAEGYYKLFVAQLPFEVSKQEIEQYFSQFGELMDTYVPQNPATGQSKGIAYVTFNDKPSAMKALNTPPGTIGGRQFKVIPSDGNKGGKGKGGGQRFSPY